ncbi:MAG: hypothetical protein ACAI38_20210 [Myxococcota bacterium]|nr:hypothetical protein [Myxococcota bacterium]
MRFVGLALIILISTACATTSGGVQTSGYRAPSVTIAAVAPVVCDAITRLARAEGWELVTVAPERGLVEAVSPTETTLGVGMRERWRFTMADYDVAVTRLLEVQFEPGSGWQSESNVAAGYGYEREHQVLASLGAQFDTTIPRY